MAENQLNDDSAQTEFAEEKRLIKHEINNALTALLGNTQILLLRGNLDENQRGRVEKIEEQARRIRELAAELKEDG